MCNGVNLLNKALAVMGYSVGKGKEGPGSVQKRGDGWMNRKRGNGNNRGARKKVVIRAVEDPVHPVQFWANTKSQRWDPLSPEKKLWSAVLEDAFQCCVNGHVSAESSKARKQEEIKRAKAWFLSEETDIGTFIWICEKLDLDPKKILNRVTALYEKRRMAA